VSTKWDWVAALYGADLAAGSRRAKREPMTRVAGYMDKRIVSREVGRKGDLLAVIFAVVEELPFALFKLGGDGAGGRFWIRFDRLGVVDGDSICSVL